jgi:integrase
MSQEDL